MEEKKVTKGLEKQTDEVVKSLENFHKGLPHLPENARDMLVKVAPWLALIFGALSVLAGVLGGLAMLFVLPFAVLGGAGSSGLTAFLGIVFLLASGVLMLMAYPKLVKRSYTGWVYLFWSEVLSVVYALLTVSFGSLLGVVVGVYLLFEVKRYYK